MIYCSLICPRCRHHVRAPGVDKQNAWANASFLMDDHKCADWWENMTEQERFEYGLAEIMAMEDTPVDDPESEEFFVKLLPPKDEYH